MLPVDFLGDLFYMWQLLITERCVNGFSSQSVCNLRIQLAIRTSGREYYSYLLDKVQAQRTGASWAHLSGVIVPFGFMHKSDRHYYYYYYYYYYYNERELPWPTDTLQGKQPLTSRSITHQQVSNLS